MSEHGDQAVRLTDLARKELDGRPRGRAHERGREQMLDMFARELAFPGRGRRPARDIAGRRPTTLRFRAIVAFAAALLVGALVFALWPKRTLTFEVEGASVTRTQTGGARFEASVEPATARFSDGSVVTFDAGAEGRIEEPTAEGARVVLSGGRVRLDVIHAERTRWSVEAGPHVVRVTGTEFEVAWDPVSSAFEVRMIRGSVLVEGPSAPSGIALEAGYVLVSDRDGEVRIARANAAAPAATPIATAQPATAAHSETPEPAPNDSAPVVASASAKAPSEMREPATRDKSWSRMVADGDYAEVVRAAKARGIDNVTESAPASDLAALADAARYEKDSAVAKAVLEAQRKRFGSTPAGRTATFLLGRMAEDSEGNLSRAIALYDEYLAGGGPFAAEALGRKMVAVRRSRGDDAARPIAAQYLALHPKGPYAAVARVLAPSSDDSAEKERP